MTALAVWRTLYTAFDPWTPARGEQRADRGVWSPVAALSRELARGLGQKHLLLLGTQGSGKTTELLRLAEERSSNFFVVYIDLWRHMQERAGDAAALERLQPWEVLVLAGLAVHRAAREELGLSWPPAIEQELAAAIAGLKGPGTARPSIDLAKLAGGMLVVTSAVSAVGPAVAGLAMAPALAAVATSGGGSSSLGQVVGGLRELAASARWEWPLGAGNSPALGAQDPEVRRLRDAVNRLVAEVQSQHKPMLIVLDGLDRVAKPDGVQRLFVDSSLLAEIEASTLVTAALTLRRPELGRRVRGWDVRVMNSVPVLDHDRPEDPSRPGAGVAFFQELVQRRHPAAAAHLPPEVVARLAWASGGLLRDFLRLVQTAIGVAVDRGLLRLDAETAEAAIDAERRQMEGVALLYTSHLDLLEAVARTRSLPDDPRIGDLIDGFCLLPYPNETEWWFPHPLLTLVKLRGRIGFGA